MKIFIEQWLGGTCIDWLEWFRSPLLTRLTRNLPDIIVQFLNCTAREFWLQAWTTIQKSCHELLQDKPYLFFFLLASKHGFLFYAAHHLCLPSFILYLFRSIKIRAFKQNQASFFTSFFSTLPHNNGSKPFIKVCSFSFLFHHYPQFLLHSCPCT